MRHRVELRGVLAGKRTLGTQKDDNDRLLVFPIVQRSRRSQHVAQGQMLDPPADGRGLRCRRAGRVEALRSGFPGVRLCGAGFWGVGCGVAESSSVNRSDEEVPTVIDCLPGRTPTILAVGVPLKKSHPRDGSDQTLSAKKLRKLVEMKRPHATTRPPGSFPDARRQRRPGPTRERRTGVGNL